MKFLILTFDNLYEPSCASVIFFVRSLQILFLPEVYGLDAGQQGLVRNAPVREKQTTLKLSHLSSQNPEEHFSSFHVLFFSSIDISLTNKGVFFVPQLLSDCSLFKTPELHVCVCFVYIVIWVAFVLFKTKSD